MTFLYVSFSIFPNGGDYFQNGVDFLKNPVDFLQKVDALFSCGADFFIR